MPNDHRAQAADCSCCFTVSLALALALALADRQSQALAQHINTLRQSYRTEASHHPFVSVAMCVLPNHLHAIWQMPTVDADFATRWRLIKSQFSRSLPASSQRSASKIAKAEIGI